MIRARCGPPCAGVLWVVLILPGAACTRDERPAPPVPRPCAERFFGAPLRIATLGDSITHGSTGCLTYRFPLWQMLKAQSVPFDMIGNLNTTWGGVDEVYPDPRFDSDHDGHFGVSAITYAERLTSGQITWPNPPDIALIHLGTNDTARLDPPPTSDETIDWSVAAYGKIVAELRRRNPAVRIVAAKIMAAGQDLRRHHWTDVFNARLIQMLEDQNRHESPILVVDQAAGLTREAHTFDGVHPNERGEQELARRWFEAIQRVLTAPGLCPRAH